MEDFACSMLKRTFEENCKVNRPLSDQVHYCFVCGKPFRISEASYCEFCNWWKSPCGHCGCSLSLEDRIKLELTFKEVCGRCRLNPKKRKGRSSDIIRGITRDEFLKWAEKFHPDWVAEYRAGRMDFDELHREIHKLTGLTWIFRD